MIDTDHARALLWIAERDRRALDGMMDPNVFSTAIFGFHAQQAVEKALKAWLCLLGVNYPKTHDLDVLGELLGTRGASLPGDLAALIEFTDFAVAFRYDAVPEADLDIDRAGTAGKVGRLIALVSGLVPPP